jgi:hypothetical protein
VAGAWVDPALLDGWGVNDGARERDGLGFGVSSGLLVGRGVAVGDAVGVAVACAVALGDGVAVVVKVTSIDTEAAAGVKVHVKPFRAHGPSASQPANVEPTDAVAVSVNEVAIENCHEQVGPHRIPSRLVLSTRPAPVPPFFTDTVAGSVTWKSKVIEYRPPRAIVRCAMSDPN